MPTTTRFDLGGGGLPGMPSFGGAGKRILQIAIVVLVIILLMASTTSIPTGNVGVLTLFGRVTGETLARRNPSGQSVEIRAKAFRSDPVDKRKRKRAFE